MKQNKAEKLLAGVLSISLAMGVSVMPAFAAQVQGPPYEDMSRVYLTKNYDQHGYDLPGRDLYVCDRAGYRDRCIGRH